MNSLPTRTISTHHLICALLNPFTQVGVPCSALTTWIMSSNIWILFPAPKTKLHLTNKSNKSNSSINSQETSLKNARVNASQQMCLIVLPTPILMMKCSLMIKAYPNTTARCRHTLRTDIVFRLRPWIWKCELMLSLNWTGSLNSTLSATFQHSSTPKTLPLLKLKSLSGPASSLISTYMTLSGRGYESTLKTQERLPLLQRVGPQIGSLLWDKKWKPQLQSRVDSSRTLWVATTSWFQSWDQQTVQAASPCAQRTH